MSRSMNRKYASARERADKHGSGFQAPYLKLPEGVILFKPKEGVMLIDILPYIVGEGNPWAKEGKMFYERTFWVHRSIGANSDSHLCLAKNFKEPCPVCEHRMRLMKRADEDDEELIKDLAPRERQLFNLRNLKDPEKKYVWDVSHHLFGKTLDATLRSADEDDDWDNFAHLEGGSSLKVSFAEESAAGRSFLKAETIYFKPRKTDYDEDVLDEVVCLDKVLVPFEYDELKKLFLQTAEEDDEGKAARRHKKDDDDDDDDRPRSRKRKEDDDDDDESRRRKKDDDDDEPRGRRRKDDDDDDDDEPHGRRKKDEDDDDDDEPEKKRKKEDDDDDDDEPPKGKKKKDDDDDWDDFDKERKPKKKDDDDDDEPQARRRKKEEDDDDDDEPKGKKKNRFASDDDDGERPRVRAGAADDDDDDEPRKRRKKDEDDD